VARVEPQEVGRPEPLDIRMFERPYDQISAIVEPFPDMAARGAAFNGVYADWSLCIWPRPRPARLPIVFADFEINLSPVLARRRQATWVNPALQVCQACQTSETD